MADIRIHGEIGDPTYGCDAAEILAQLRAYRSQPVTLHIDSGGGSFYEGLTVYNALRQRTAPTVATLGAMCGSAATVIACGCTRVVMPKSSSYFVHQTLKLTVGHAKEHRDALGWLEHADKLLIDLYVERTKQSAKTIERLVEGNGDGTVLSTDEALRFGFVDEILQPAATRKTANEMQNAIFDKLAERQAFRIEQALSAKQSRRLKDQFLRKQLQAARAR
jgi:ATP-dependent Clp protease protease subunit